MDREEFLNFCIFYVTEYSLPENEVLVSKLVCVISVTVKFCTERLHRLVKCLCFAAGNQVLACET